MLEVGGMVQLKNVRRTNCSAPARKSVSGLAGRCDSNLVAVSKKLVIAALMRWPGSERIAQCSHDDGSRGVLAAAGCAAPTAASAVLAGAAERAAVGATGLAPLALATVGRLGSRWPAALRGLLLPGSPASACPPALPAARRAADAGAAPARPDWCLAAAPEVPRPGW